METQSCTHVCWHVPRRAGPCYLQIRSLHLVPRKCQRISRIISNLFFVDQSPNTGYRRELHIQVDEERYSKLQDRSDGGDNLQNLIQCADRLARPGSALLRSSNLPILTENVSACPSDRLRSSPRCGACEGRNREARTRRCEAARGRSQGIMDGRHSLSGRNQVSPPHSWRHKIISGEPESHASDGFGDQVHPNLNPNGYCISPSVESLLKT